MATSKKAPKLGVPITPGFSFVGEAEPGDYEGVSFVPTDPGPAAAPPTSSGMFRRIAGDGGLSLLKGAIGVPEAAVGLADLVTGGAAGQAAESIGFRPKEAKAMLDEYYSPEQKAANQQVQDAQGFGGTMVAALKNPSVIAHSALESVPAMGAGGVLARGAMMAVPRMASFAAAGLGEGVVSAGQTAEQVRQETADGRLTGTQSLVSAGSGMATGALGMLAGKVASRLGIGDIDTMIAGGAKAGVKAGAAGANTAQKGFVRSFLEGAFSEGVLEELPQSVQEQVSQNYALGKPLDEGVDHAAVLGMLTGGAMGGGAQFFHGKPAVAEVGPLSRGANQATAAANALGAAQAAAAPATPSQAPISDAQRATLLAHANTRAAELETKAAGTKDEKGKDGSVTPGTPKEFLTPQEQAEKDFLSEKGGDADALARAYPVEPEAPVAPPPASAAAFARGGLNADTDAALARIEAMGVADVKAQRQFGGPSMPRPAAPAAPAPAADDTAPEHEPGDVLNPRGAPFKERSAALRAQKVQPDPAAVVLASVKGGYVLRPIERVAAPVPIAGAPIDGEWTAFTPESGTKGHARADMPQIKAEHRGAMVQFLAARGITHEAVEIPAADLKPTQAEFSPAKVEKARGFTDTDRSILVSSDGHVLDGHHQWMAKRQDAAPIKAIRLNAPIDQLLEEVKQFPSARTAAGAPTLSAAPPSAVIGSKIDARPSNAPGFSARDVLPKPGTPLAQAAEPAQSSPNAGANEQNPQAGARPTEAAAPQAPDAAGDRGAEDAGLPAAGAAAGVEAAGVGEVIDHVTSKGKTIRGVVRQDLSQDEAIALDSGTFKKDTPAGRGYFIRERSFDKLRALDAKRAVEKPAPVEPVVDTPAEPAPKETAVERRKRLAAEKVEAPSPAEMDATDLDAAAAPEPTPDKPETAIARRERKRAELATASGPRAGTEEEGREAGFTLTAYRGTSKSVRFNDSGTVWLTLSSDVAQAYAEEVMGYDDPEVVTVLVKPDGIPRHDASRLTDEQREALGADEFGNPQAIGIYDRSDDHPLGGGGNVTVLHVPISAVFVVQKAAPAKAAKSAPAPAATDDAARPEHVIALRKRVSVLESIRKCLA